MATYGSCGQIIVSAAGSTPPAVLDATKGEWIGGSPANTLFQQVGCTQTAAVTLATLTEVLNITGSGVFTFAALHTESGNVTDYKLRIVIDGVEVTSEAAGGSLDQDGAVCTVGSAASPTGAATFSESTVIFNTSFAVEIAGDGTNEVVFSYKRYLT